MRIIKTKSYEEMSKKAANIIASVVTLKPDCMLGLATGSSPIGTYDELVKKYEAGDLDFSEVTTVNLDEYKGLPKENEQSYYYFMHEYLRFFESADDVPKQAYSMGIGTIMRSKKILLVVSGEEKAQALKDSIYGPVTPEVPGSILRFHPDVTIIADEAAMSLIK